MNKKEVNELIWLTWFNYIKEYIKDSYGEDEWEEIMTMCGDPLASIHFAKIEKDIKIMKALILRGEEE